MTQASATGDPSGSWLQAMTCDGFGNLTQKSSTNAPALSVSVNQWFGKRLVSPEDRLGSKGKYFAFGEERTNVSPANPPNDQEKFATYTRDSATGLDYANQRCYSYAPGRFLTPDPHAAGTEANQPSSPETWNHYTYVVGDPVNLFDPSSNCSASVIAGGQTTTENYGCGLILAGGLDGLRITDL